VSVAEHAVAAVQAAREAAAPYPAARFDVWHAGEGALGRSRPRDDEPR
jgi:hypothetical protein